MPPASPNTEAAARRRIADLGLELPPAPNAVASYVPVRVVGNLAHVSGQIPMSGGKPLATGSVPDRVDPETARGLAERCALQAIAAVEARVGDLDRVLGVVRVGGFVASTPAFTDHPTVVNGASELFQAVFGEAGRHARAAVGCSSLPLGVPVEIEVTFEIDPV